MDRLQSMRAFCLVASQGSFARAATELDISSTVVSRLVADHEQHVRTRLLNRTTRCVNLTEAGHEYLQRCLQILEQIDEADAHAAGQTGLAKGKLRLLISFSEGLKLLAPHLNEFRTRYPELMLDVHLAERPVDIIQEQFDLAIQPKPFVFSNSVVIRELMQARLILCASPAYLAARGTPQTPADIAQHDCVSFSDDALLDRWPLQGPSGLVVAKPNNVLVSNNIEAIQWAMYTGMGLGLAFDWLIEAELQTGRLVRVLPDHHVPDLKYFIVYPSRKYLPAKVRVMIDFLLDLFKNAGSPQVSHLTKK